MIKVLVVDDDDGLRLSLASLLKGELGALTYEARHGQEALEIFDRQSIDLVLLDIDMSGMSGMEVLHQLKEKNAGVIVIILTAFATIELAVEAVKKGAFQFLQKPVSSEALISVIQKALDAYALISRVAASQPLLMEEGRPFLGHHLQMQKVFHLIYRLSKVDTPVLIRGASGTGKELVARAIHFNSARKEGKFVAINCSAIPETLFESELFGHEKGAFTGADQRKIGKIQYAEGGTLFLDEVGDLPLLMQVKLLRVLQEKVFIPVGSNREIPMNARIIAATNRPLEEMIKSGQFREDLYYRLNVIPIFLPSLVDRIDDLNILVPNFIRKFNELHGRKMVGISVDAMNVLKKYHWPGNIRELENVIEHAFVMEPSNMITVKSLPESIRMATKTILPEVQYEEELFQSGDEDELKDGLVIAAERRFHRGSGREHRYMQEGEGKDLGSSSEEGFGLGEEETMMGSGDGSSDSEDGDEASSMSGSSSSMSGAHQQRSEELDFNAQKEAFEREFIIKALKMFKGRINQTALHANIPKKTLLRKIEKYGINAKDFIE
ncbi:MAG: sigma-54 dependent transcriptional regulator [Bdellovibrionaceae bacterium]|nr:sigma-54 dependent transcriptional regulator [Pseudobdellovibrionaceae bacterium]MDW8190110.1 sigma-54 dependent transcriptional regulator [Pseudobdellovibrionaceae bacterium]